MTCRQGEVISLSFDPMLGYEPAKRRPAVVISADGFIFMPA